MTTRAVPTVCHECYAYCGVVARVDETGRIKEIAGNPDHPLSQGFICPKGAHFTEIVYHPDRLLYPLKRAGERGEGRWSTVSWDEALDYVSDEVMRIRQELGPQAFVFFPHHMFRLPLWTLFMRFLGNNNAISCLDRCDGGAFITDHAVFGGSLTCSLDWDYEHSRCIALWGCNPARSFPVYWQHILRGKRQGARLLVIDPMRTEAAEAADLWLQVRPGSDPALALGMLNVIINEKLYDAPFVEKWCTGFDRVRQHVQQYPPEVAASTAGVSVEQVRAAARMFADGPSCFAPMRNGVVHKQNATQTFLAHSIMLAITGNVDVPGADMFMKPFEGVQYEGNLILDPEFRLAPEIDAQTWGTREFPLYREGCQTAAHSTVIWQNIEAGNIKAMFVAGSDPVMTHANTRENIRAIQKLDLLMVADYFMSPTAEFADIVLPAASWCERDDVRTRSSDAISAVQAAIDPPGECRDDNRIAIDLANCLKKKGYPSVLEFPWQTTEEFNASRFRNCGMSFGEFKKKGVLVFPKRYRSYERAGFRTPSGKIELCPSRFEAYGYSPLPEHVEPFHSHVSSPEVAREFPLVLITGSREVDYYHSSHRQTPSMRKAHPWPTFRIHPETADEHGIAGEDWCWIRTPWGECRLRAEVTDRVLPGVVLAQHGWWFPEDKSTTTHALNDSNVNLVTYKSPFHGPALKLNSGVGGMSLPQGKRAVSFAGSSKKS